MAEPDLPEGRLFDPRPAPRWRWLLYAGGCAAGLLIAFPASVTTGAARAELDEADVWHLHYVLEHTWRWVAAPGYRHSFWSPPCFYPAEQTLTYSDNLIGSAPIYWLLRTRLSEVSALYGWLWIVSALNYMAMLAVLRGLGVDHVLSALGAFLFAFAAPRQEFFSHLSTAPQFLTPVALYQCWQFTRRPRRGSFFLLTACAAGQMFMSIQLGWFLGFALGVWFCWLTVVDRGCRTRMFQYARANWRFVGGTLAATALVVWLFLRHYYLGSGGVRRTYLEVSHLCPTITDWFTAGPGFFWSDRLTINPASCGFERHLFAGLGMLALLPAALLAGWQHRPEAAGLFSLTAGGAAATIFLLALDFGGQTSLWYFVYHVIPGANAVRGIIRVWAVVLPLTLLGGLAAAQIVAEAKLTRRQARIAYWLLAALCVSEQVDFRKTSWPREHRLLVQSQVSEQLRDADAAYVVPPPTESSFPVWDDTVVMWAGLRANIAVVNGYSGREPIDYVDRAASEPLVEALRFLGPDWKGRLLIVEWRPAARRTWYAVRPGENPAGRAQVIATDGTAQ